MAFTAIAVPIAASVAGGLASGAMGSKGGGGGGGMPGPSGPMVGNVSQGPGGAILKSAAPAVGSALEQIIRGLGAEKFPMPPSMTATPPFIPSNFQMPWQPGGGSFTPPSGGFNF